MRPDSQTLSDNQPSDPLYKANSHKQVSLICFSNVVASFNFLIYIHLANIISDAFFIDTEHYWLAQLRVIAIFAIGFISRPIGGFLVGRYGDAHGRKPALRLSLSFLAATTLLTAFLPTYAQVGILAPIAFVIIRLFQGMAFGAQAPLSWVFIAEHVYKRNLAFYCGLVTASLILGTLISLIFFNILNDMLTYAELLNYGWRIAFMVGGILSLIAFFLSYTFAETPIFQHAKEETIPDAQLIPDITSFSKIHAVLLTIFLCFVQASIVVLVAILLPQLLSLQFKIDRSFLMGGNIVGLIFMMIGSLFFGLMADKGNIGKVMMIGSAALTLQISIFYYHIMSHSQHYILIMYALLGFFCGVMTLCPTIYVRLFSTSKRLTTVSTIYNIVFAITGAVIPFALVYATSIISLAPALYLVFVSLIALIIGFYLYQLPSFQAHANFSTTIEGDD